jgi:enoyl-CoA hydratase/carnithine racemase
MFRSLKIERLQGYAILTLNGPEAMNALSRELLGEMRPAMAQLEADPEVRVLILTGAGRAFCAVGVVPAWGLSQRLSRLIGIHRSKEMSLTGNVVGAEQAAAWGLANRVVPDAELLTQARALAVDMLSVVPHMLTDYKSLIDDGAALSLGAALALESERAVAANGKIAPAALKEREGAVRACR